MYKSAIIMMINFKNSKKILSMFVCICAFCMFMQFNGLINWKNRAGRAAEEEAVSPDISIGHLEKDRFDYIIIEAAQKYDLDPFLIKAIIEIESQFNHRAVSRKGAKGLMQLMPAIARLLNVEDTFDARANIYGGALHLRGLLNRYKSVERALGFYYAGNRYRRKPEIGYSYIKKVLSKYYHFKDINNYLCKTNTARDDT